MLKESPTAEELYEAYMDANDSLAEPCHPWMRSSPIWKKASPV